MEILYVGLTDIMQDELEKRVYDNEKLVEASFENFSS